MSKNRTYNFVLVLSGVSETDGRVEDALYDAGCDDATLAFRAGIAYLEFDRRGTSGATRRITNTFAPTGGVTSATVASLGCCLSL